MIPAAGGVLDLQAGPAGGYEHEAPAVAAAPPPAAGPTFASAAVVDDTHIDVTFTVVTGPLTNGANAKAGFTVTSDSGSHTVSAVAVTVSPTVRLTLATPLGANPLVSQDGSSTIRDSQSVPQAIVPFTNEAALAPPTNLVATGTLTGVDLAWDAVVGAITYTLERGTDGITFGTSFTLIATNSYTDSSGAAGTLYYYRVKAVNAGGPSVASNIDSSGFVTFTDSYLLNDDPTGNTWVDALTTKPLTGHNTPTRVSGRLGQAIRFTAASSEYADRADTAVTVTSGYEMAALINAASKTVGMGMIGQWQGGDSWLLYYDAAAGQPTHIVSASGSNKNLNYNYGNQIWFPTGVPIPVQWCFDQANGRIGISVNGGPWMYLAAASVDSPAGVNFALGNYGGANFFNGSIERLGLFSAPQTDAVRAVTLKGWLGGQVRSADPVVLCDGNSRTFGQGSTAGNDYPSQLATLLGAPWTVSNYGVNGQSVREMLSDARTQVAANTCTLRSRNVVVLWECINAYDKDSYTAQQCVDALTQYTQRFKARGCEVYVCTEIPTAAPPAVAGYPTMQAAFNALAAANPFGADGLVRLDLDARLSNPNDATYFDADTIHLNDTGYGVVAALVKAAIDAGTAVGAPPYANSLVPPTLAVDGPMQWWLLGDVAGDGEDNSLHAHDLAPHGGVTMGIGRHGPCGVFASASTQYADTTAPHTDVDSSQGFELGCAVKFTSVGALAGLVGRDVSGANNAVLLYLDGSSKINAFIKDNAGSNLNIQDSGSAVTTGVWYTVQMYYDSAAQEMGLNVAGAGWQTLSTATHTINNATGAFEVARSVVGYLNGQLERIYLVQGAQGSTWRTAARTWLGN